MQTQLDWFDVDGEVRPTTLELTNSGGDKGRDRFKPVKCDPWKPLPRDVAGRRDNTEPRAQIKRPRLPTAPDEAMAAEGTAYALMPANSPCVCQDVVANARKCIQGSAKAVRGTVARGVGTTASTTEAAGCVLWEEHRNVDYNTKTEQPVCNVRGTCLCEGSDGRVMCTNPFRGRRNPRGSATIEQLNCADGARRSRGRRRAGARILL